MTNTVLIDARNFDQVAIPLINKIKACDFVGLDTETQDDNRHEGLNQYCGYDPVTRKKAATAKTVFDIRRTVMTGFSLWPEGDDTAYYVNLNHADVENRLPWDKAKLLLDAKRPDAFWVAHNANYELTVFSSCYNYELDQYLCTMQMAVSAFGPDEYPLSSFISAGQGGLRTILPAIQRESVGYEPGKDPPPALAEVLYKVIGKTSDAAHSYNGFVKDIAYGYGLKKLVERFFGVKMQTFQETLGDKAHMGQLTGEETASYGADDAYWAVRLFRHLLDYMTKNCPAAVPTYFQQENPMVRKFSKIWTGGMKVNTQAIYSRKDSERQMMAIVLRGLKSDVKKLLPFQVEPHEGLLADGWYEKNYARYRQQIIDWANSPDSDDDFEQCYQVRGPVSNEWAVEKGKPESIGPNFSHYMPVRTLIYDLTQAKVIRYEGKIQSDGEARGKLIDRLEGTAADLISGLNMIAGIEQRIKLYLKPYTQLMDPETGRLYPVVSSMLASRRMACSYPNAMQLAKRGESTYVRGFFEADYEDHVIVSIDWSSIELVEIGEFSADPEFIKAYGQIPHADLHAGAAADILGVEVPGLDEQRFKALRDFKTWDEYREANPILSNVNRLSTNLKGEELPIEKAYKYWRTEVGKGANFNYWYSGFLGTIGERMGWSTEKTGEATDRYRNRFHVAEKWRTDLIEEVTRNGYVTLPDGHRRVRFEATNMWMEYFLDKLCIQGADQYNAAIQWMARKIQKRAHNQAVNSMIQGSCATIAKRSVIRIDDKMEKIGWTPREARFMVPIHDELVFSVHRSIVPDFITMARGTMLDHPDIFKHCKLDASPSVGLTFEPWHEKKAPFGQIELYEAPKIAPVPADMVNKRLNDNQVRDVVDYLFDVRKAA